MGVLVVIPGNRLIFVMLIELLMKILPTLDPRGTQTNLIFKGHEFIYIY